jgi:hypothetical protein
MSRVEGVTPATLAIGMRVDAFVDQAEGAPLLLFQPVED